MSLFTNENILTHVCAVRYQWSVGFTNHDDPTGIFDRQHERMWQDAGQLNFVVYNTKPGRNLD